MPQVHMLTCLLCGISLARMNHIDALWALPLRVPLRT